MYRLLLISALLLLVNCTPGKKPATEVPKQEKVQAVKPPAVKKITPDLITDENVEEKLLAFGRKNPQTIVLIHTTKGTIKAKLYKDTPLHRANFILLAGKGYFNGSVFTRVSKNFIAQGGGAYDEKNVEIRKAIGNYTIPAEIRPQYFHKKGALGAARSYNDNPDKRSDACDFYFVEGTLFNSPTLDKYEKENEYHYSAAQREYYLEQAGAAHIDGQHTVFGEVIEGFSVIPKLTSVATDSKDWPLEDLFIDSVEIIR